MAFRKPVPGTPTPTSMIGAAFLGVIWSVLSAPLVVRIEPDRRVRQQIAVVAVGFGLILIVVWIAVFYGLLTLWARRR